jgi:hypothetical protein
MAQKELTVMVKLDFSELERLFDEYISGKPDDDGGEVYGSYRSQARDQVDDFLAWLKRRRTKLAGDGDFCPDCDTVSVDNKCSFCGGVLVHPRN